MELSIFKALFVPLPLSCGTIVCLSSPIIAQVTTDGTVNTQITQNGNVSEITGGTVRGSNLFHSFQDFSIPNENEAFFNNGTSIGNIFSRVTGGNISNINGVIRANGPANLFLINPAGIVLGENARLNLGGSFYGSTASSILFEDGEFSAVNNIGQPILTINAPVGLGFRDEPGRISNSASFGRTEQAFVQEIDGESTEISRVTDVKGLQVNPGQNLALLGGDISLEGGGITAPGGNVVLGGLTQAGQIDLNPDGSFSFPSDVTKANLSLSDSSRVSVVSGGGGFIHIDVNNLTLEEQSILSAGIGEGLGSPNAEAGDIVINAAESITLIGSGETEGPQLDLDTGIFNMIGLPPARIGDSDEEVSTAQGNTGSILINSKSLNITERSAVGVRVYGVGNAKDVEINVDSVELNQGVIASQVPFDGGGRGDSGNINIKTTNFSAINNSFVATDNYGVGEVNAGDIDLIATNSIVLAGADELSAFISQLGGEATGDAGEINIIGNSFKMDGNAQLLATNQGQGNAGNIKLEIAESVVISGGADIQAQVNTGTQDGKGNIEIASNSFELSGDAQILANTRGPGNSGDIMIDAKESASFIGSLVKTGADVFTGGKSGTLTINSPEVFLKDGTIISASTSGNGESSDILIDSDVISIDAFSLIAASSRSDSSGDSGSITLEADVITLSNGGVINSSTSGEFDGGEVTINAQVLELLSGGVLQTATDGDGNAGDITLNISDKITLDGNNAPIEKSSFEDDILSNVDKKTGIFANADQDNLQSNGGNINVNTDFIVAFPGGDSDILTNSRQGQGGNITINAESLLGILERPLNSLTNDINASSEFSLDGNVTVRTSDLNPVQGITELPENIVVPEATAQQACQANSGSATQSSFLIQGSGGIVPAPDSPLGAEGILINGNQVATEEIIPKSIETSQGKIQPARGIKMDESGRVMLTAYRTNNSGERIYSGPRKCDQA